MIKQWTEEKLGAEARAALRAGVDRVARQVAATMGGKGRNVAFAEFGRAKPTNDGVSIARRIFPKDPYERMGADLVKEAAESTVNQAGDGTTLTTVLSQSIAEFGEKAVGEGKDPLELRLELQEAARAVVEKIKEAHIDVKGREDVLNVARVSVEDEEMASMIADSIESAGRHGVIMTQEGSGYALEKEESKGYFWERGYVSPYMVTNVEGGRARAVLEDVPVIVTDRYLNLNRDLMQTLNELKAGGHSRALIVADRCEGELLQSLIINKQNGAFIAIVVQRPGTLEELEDIAAVTGATAVTKDKGIKEITGMHIGRAKRVVVEESKTTIMADERPDVLKRVEQIEAEIAEARKEKGEPDELLITRKAKLADGVVVIRVGAKTEAEIKYKKDKLDDAVAAAKASVEEGIVAGGGVTLHGIAQAGLGLGTKGEEVLCAAMRRPYQQILKNAGIEPDGKAYNVKTGKAVKDMVKEGIVDPAKVLRCAVENSVAFAGVFLTIEGAIADFAEETGQQ
jgi:chaperonin GroEL